MKPAFFLFELQLSNIQIQMINTFKRNVFFCLLKYITIRIQIHKKVQKISWKQNKFSNPDSKRKIFNKYNSQKRMDKQKTPAINQHLNLAFQNTRNFQHLIEQLSSTNKKSISSFSQEPEQKTTKLSKAESICFGDGWEYVGGVRDGKFDGKGCLSFQGKTIYWGSFIGGRMQGIGKLYCCEYFEDLIDDEEWALYEGQFKNGNVSGFGTLYLKNQSVILGKRENGKTVFSTMKKNQKEETKY